MIKSFYLVIVYSISCFIATGGTWLVYYFIARPYSHFTPMLNMLICSLNSFYAVTGLITILIFRTHRRMNIKQISLYGFSSGGLSGILLGIILIFKEPGIYLSGTIFALFVPVLVCLTSAWIWSKLTPLKKKLKKLV